MSLTERRDSFKQLLEEMNQKYESLKSKLQENETHAQVRAFHTRLRKTSLYKGYAHDVTVGSHHGYKH